MDESRKIEVREASQVGEARRAATYEAEHRGFSEATCGSVAIVATEMATNLIKHAQGGCLVLGPGAGGGLDLTAIDSGRGMYNVSECLRDGISTAGTGGGGLGAIQRLAGLFDVYSHVDQGTVVYAGFGPAQSTSQSICAGISLAKGGEPVCGDRWAFGCGPMFMDMVVADGLGHGADAAVAARAAVEAWCLQHSQVGAAGLLEIAHRALRSTRGAAVAYARFNTATAMFTFAGLGNIGGAIVDLDCNTRHLLSYNGTVGVQARTFREFEYPVPKGAVVVLFSDGLVSRWDLTRYPGLLYRHPAVIAGVLWRDYTQGRDDVTVAVFRPPSEEGLCAV